MCIYIQVLGSLVGFVLGAMTGGEVWWKHYAKEWWSGTSRIRFSPFYNQF